MTYIATDESTEIARPVELYFFRQKQGTERSYYTSGNVSVDYDGNTYAPESIKRTSFKVDGRKTGGTLTVTVPRTNSFAERYNFGTPPLPDELTIYRVHLTDTDSEVQELWSGDVSAVSFANDEAKISLSSLSERTNLTIPKRTYSWTCNHVLYDAGCRLSAQANRSDASVLSISSDERTLTIANASSWAGQTMTSRIAADATFFNGGYLRFVDSLGTEYYRTIQSLTESGGVYTLALEIPLNNLFVGNELQCHAGCNHAVQTCRDKFDNVKNYGGFPFVPTSNPFSTGIVTEDDEATG